MSVGPGKKFGFQSAAENLQQRRWWLVAMTAGVFRGEIYMTPSDSVGPKIGGRRKQGAIIFHGGRVVVYFCPKICCHGNRGRQGRNLNDTVG